MKVVAYERSVQGTGASRRLRREGKVPAIVYGGNAQPVNIRSLSWPNANASGSATENRQGEGMLTARTLTVDALKQSVVADTNRVNLCLNRLAQDGSMSALPMISVDGLEFAA